MIDDSKAQEGAAVPVQRSSSGESKIPDSPPGRTEPGSSNSTDKKQTTVDMVNTGASAAAAAHQSSSEESKVRDALPERTGSGRDDVGLDEIHGSHAEARRGSNGEEKDPSIEASSAPSKSSGASLAEPNRQSNPSTDGSHTPDKSDRTLASSANGNGKPSRAINVASKDTSTSFAGSGTLKWSPHRCLWLCWYLFSFGCNVSLLYLSVTVSARAKYFWALHDDIMSTDISLRLNMLLWSVWWTVGTLTLLRLVLSIWLVSFPWGEKDDYYIFALARQSRQRLTKEGIRVFSDVDYAPKEFGKLLYGFPVKFEGYQTFAKVYEDKSYSDSTIYCSLRGRYYRSLLNEQLREVYPTLVGTYFIEPPRVQISAKLGYDFVCQNCNDAAVSVLRDGVPAPPTPTKDVLPKGLWSLTSKPSDKPTEEGKMNHVLSKGGSEVARVLVPSGKTVKDDSIAILNGEGRSQFIVTYNTPLQSELWLITCENKSIKGKQAVFFLNFHHFGHKCEISWTRDNVLEIQTTFRQKIAGDAMRLLDGTIQLKPTKLAGTEFWHFHWQ